MASLKDYYQLTKPGIVYGNSIAAAAGFFLASRGHPSAVLLLATLVGLGLVMASGCVYNNYLDRNIDALMNRTRKRALVQGVIATQNALIYATMLGIIGLGILAYQTNLLTVVLAFAGLTAYVVWYGYGKRRSSYGTVIGSLSGAIPPVVGYCAVTNHFDTAAVLLFLILSLWQMPHFYAIALFRLKDYQAAKIPVLPAVGGTRLTKKHILVYIVGFAVAALALTWTGYTGYSFAVAITSISAVWFWKGLQGFKAMNDVQWGRSMFNFSLVVLMVTSVMLSVSALLP